METTNSTHTKTKGEKGLPVAKLALPVTMAQVLLFSNLALADVSMKNDYQSPVLSHAELLQNSIDHSTHWWDTNSGCSFNNGCGGGCDK